MTIQIKIKTISIQILKNTFHKTSFSQNLLTNEIQLSFIASKLTTSFITLKYNVTPNFISHYIMHTDICRYKHHNQQQKILQPTPLSQEPPQHINTLTYILYQDGPRIITIVIKFHDQFCSATHKSIIMTIQLRKSNINFKNATS